MVLGHEASNSGDGGILPKTNNLSVINTVVLQGGKGDVLVNMFNLLGLGVNLLLSLLSSSTKTEDKVQGRFLLDVVVRESTSIFQLLSSKDKTLLVWGDSFLILDLGLHILDSVRRLHIKRDGLS